jgi:hypothetical protein
MLMFGIKVSLASLSNLLTNGTLQLARGHWDVFRRNLACALLEVPISSLFIKESIAEVFKGAAVRSGLQHCQHEWRGQACVHCVPPDLQRSVQHGLLAATVGRHSQLRVGALKKQCVPHVSC